MTDRSPLPPMKYQTPLCPICNDNVGTDGDLFWCEKCGGTWGSESYDAPGEARADVEQCPAEVAPFDDYPEKYPSLVGERYRCVRDIDHPQDVCERHIGMRSDGGPDYSGYPFEWRDGDYPQWTAEATAVSS